MTIPTDAELWGLIPDAWTMTVETAPGAKAIVLCNVEDFARAVLTKWGQPQAVASGEPVDPHAALRAAWVPGYKWEWASAKERQWWAHNGEPEWDPDWQYRLAPPPQAVREPLNPDQVTAAAKKLAECMDYPWEHMNHDGRVAMHKHAKAVIEAAHGITKGGQHG